MDDDEFGAVIIGLPTVVLLALMGRWSHGWPTWEAVHAGAGRGALAVVVLGVLLIAICREL